MRWTGRKERERDRARSLERDHMYHLLLLIK